MMINYKKWQYLWKYIYWNLLVVLKEIALNAACTILRVCLSVYLFFFLSDYQSFCIKYNCTYVCIYLSLFRISNHMYFVHLSLCLSILLSVLSKFYLFIYLSIYKTICQIYSWINRDFIQNFLIKLS